MNFAVAAASAFNKLDANTLALNFRASPTEASADGSGLAPGTCSWIDRVVNNSEPRRIQFTVSAAQAKSIPAHLNEAKNYWSFFVVNTNKGFFEAKSHTVWQPGTAAPAPPAGSGNSQPPGQPNDRVTKSQRDKLGSVTLPRKRNGDEIITKPPYGNEDMRLPAIRDLIFSPTMNGATVTFVARPGPEPVVELDKKTPFKDSANHASFNPPILRFNPVAMKNKSTPTGTAYAGGSYQANIKLEQGTLYHYIITVPIPGSNPYQQTGSFKTLSRTARVTFTRIKILDDSDADGSGELYFYLSVNPAEPSQAVMNIGGSSNKLDWESGHIERLEGRLPLIIKNAPDRLRILVEGYDDDAPGIPSPGVCQLPPTREHDPLWFDHLRPRRECPGTTLEKEVNYAKGEFDLSKYPGKYVNIPFTITSMALGPHGVTLTFDVSGYIEFTNPDVT